MSIILGLKTMNSLKYLIVNNNIHKDELTSSVTVHFTAVIILYRKIILRIMCIK